MDNDHILVGEAVVLEARQLQALMDVLRKEHYRIVGPTIRDQAIVYEDISSIEELPQGWTDEQGAGSYRLKKRTDQAFFGYGVGPKAWKKFLSPESVRLWSADRDGAALKITQDDPQNGKTAFFGVRPCELKAILIQDKVFTGGPFTDPIYKRRRDQTFIVAVNCSQAGENCFCDSMDAGPVAQSHHDLALTEILSQDRHFFLADIGSKEGARILASLPVAYAQDDEREAAKRVQDCTRNQMRKALQTDGIKELLYRNYDHPRWEDVASRCLSCANCTLVCPTCFCTTVEDLTDLAGNHAERWRKWDSCFHVDFAYIHGGSVRSSVKSRYRQWMVHKLATWIDQFGQSGCVGCGRCISWCPVGIDITEEVKAIRNSETKHPGTGTALGGNS